jgi:hypothetical protein
MKSSTPGKPPSAGAAIKAQPLRGEGIALARPTIAAPNKTPPSANDQRGKTRVIPPQPRSRVTITPGPSLKPAPIHTRPMPNVRPAQNMTAKQEIRK